MIKWLSVLLLFIAVHAQELSFTNVTKKELREKWKETADFYQLSTSRKKLVFNTLNSNFFSGISLKKEAHQFGPGNRSCCSLGNDVNVRILPLLKIKVNQHVDLDTISPHSYANSEKEKIGHVYTCNGGFIDMGHLRHNADYMLYFTLLYERFYQEGGTFPLKNEGGKRWITLKKTDLRFSKESILKIAKKITYDTALWHEIATWYGPTVFFLYPEKNSSFTAEDNYSNLLGINIAEKALMGSGNFDELMDKLTRSALKRMKVQTKEVTQELLTSVDNDWVMPDVANQSDYRTLKRNMQSYGAITPWLPEASNKYCDSVNIEKLRTPETVQDLSGKKHKIKDLYEIHIFPKRKIKLFDKREIVSSRDFEKFIDIVKEEIVNYYKKGGFTHEVFSASSSK